MTCSAETVAILRLLQISGPNYLIFVEFTNGLTPYNGEAYSVLRVCHELQAVLRPSFGVVANPN